MTNKPTHLYDLTRVHKGMIKVRCLSTGYFLYFWSKKDPDCKIICSACNEYLEPPYHLIELIPNAEKE